MSGTLIIQAAGADMSANPQSIILPGSLATGLEGFFYLNQSLANATRNLAPGGVQGAVVGGAPTIGAGFLNLQTGANTINSGILETGAETLVFAGRTDDPLITTDQYWAGNNAADLGQGSGVVGTSNYSFHGTSPTNGTLSSQAYFGASFATRAPVTISFTGQNVTAWAVYAMTIQGVSPWLIKVRNLTSGASAQGNGANPRQFNTVQPYIIGGRPQAGLGATSQMAVWAKWNRDLSDTECANVRSLVIAPYLSGKWGIAA